MNFHLVLIAIAGVIGGASALICAVHAKIVGDVEPLQRMCWHRFAAVFFVGSALMAMSSLIETSAFDVLRAHATPSFFTWQILCMAGAWTYHAVRLEIFRYRQRHPAVLRPMLARR